MTNVLRELIEAAEAAIREFFDPTAELIQRHNKMRVLSSVIAAYKSALTPTPTDRECAEAVINLWAKESFDSLILDKDWVQTAATGKAMAESKCVDIIAAHVEPYRVALRIIEAVTHVDPDWQDTTDPDALLRSINDRCRALLRTSPERSVGDNANGKEG